MRKRKESAEQCLKRGGAVICPVYLLLSLPLSCVCCSRGQAVSLITPLYFFFKCIPPFGFP